MKKRNKLFSLLFVAILVCACVFPMLFAFDCPSINENDPDARSFFYIENHVRYVCVKENKTAYVKGIYCRILDKNKGEYVEPDYNDVEVVVIPGTIKNGEYKVVGLCEEDGTTVLGNQYVTSSLAPTSWMNIKKVYLPYTIERTYYEMAFEAKEPANYDGRLQVILPSIDAVSGSLDKFKHFYFNGHNNSSLKDAEKYILAITPQKHYDMVEEEQNAWLKKNLDYPSDYFVRNLVTPNYVFNFNYEGAPNEGIYWIDLIQDENTVFVLPTNPTREGYTFGGWYTEEDCITEWDGKMTPATEVKNMYAKWVPVETEQPTESEETVK